MIKTQTAKLPSVLKTDRLMLRQPELDHSLALKMFQQIELSRDALKPWLPWVFQIKNVDDVYEQKCVRDRMRINCGTTYIYNIFSKSQEQVVQKPTDNNDFLGAIEIFNFGGDHYLHVWLSTTAMGRGYMSEALGMCENVFFSSNKKPLYGNIVVDNASSRRLVERSGYAPVCLRKSGFYHSYLNKKYDEIQYIKTHDTWVHER